MFMIVAAQVIEVIDKALSLMVLLVFIPEQSYPIGLSVDGEDLKASHYVLLQAIQA